MRPPGKPSAPSVPKEHPALSYRPPTYLSAFKVMSWGLLLLAAFAILHVFYWFYMASEFRVAAIQWRDSRRAEGYTVTHSRMQVGGFPFILRLVVEDPALGHPGAPAPWAWSGGLMVVETRPWSPQDIRFRLSGAQTLDLNAGGWPRRYAGVAQELAGHVVVAGGVAAAGDIAVKKLDFTAADSGARLSVGEARISIRRLFAEAPDYTTPTLDAEFLARDLHLPAEFDLPLGNRVGTVDIVARVLGPFPEGPLPEVLAAWRDAGGTVDVTRLGAEYGPLTVRANGTLALDAGLQPVGALTARVQGFFETVDVLRERGVVRTRDAVTAKIVLGVLARKPSGGGAPVINLAITVQNRTFFAGPVPLGRLPRISWDGGDAPRPSAPE